MNRFGQGTYAAALMLLVLAGCKNDEPATATPDTAVAEVADAASPQAPAPVEMRDVIENTPSHVIGISYPPAAAKYPGLAAALVEYAEHTRAELLKAVGALGNDKPTAPYELSLAFDMLVDTPAVVAVSAEGSSYTGGAHGQPLVARFVWLPEKQQALAAEQLITGAKGWQAISEYSREKLLEQAMARVPGEDLDPDEQQRQIRVLSKMIDDGTGAEAVNFSQFQPVLDGAGKIGALRFVFPPYQVGPYSDGTQSVDVPAAVLLPHVAAEYRGLFAQP
ncbi:hypothetical protein ARC78_08935 [Stenotrophomonas pictorum JCM 9942]|jgi:hypothetical protein|uniref:Uncharacterized protein n=1 Tax=Stenotrophomonas pictorum JCM 9942 TaxID=1236960 RepID=A0A0R0APG1_9GAMM|nr:DUF3298 and DUF4163 domain-containing protein [Stenotrophomonas pictorum]KRG42801.1 hypothetical protein ARC78_08935 [Stenotrophomonas pictorum JCM 9942]